MKPARHIFPSPGFQHYWTEGLGKVMIKKLKHVPDEDEIDAHIPRLFEVDSIADQVIRDVHLKIGLGNADQLMGNILLRGIEQFPDVPESVKNLFEQVERIPLWLDQEKLRDGSSFCRRSGSLGLIVLRNYCLMGGYESAAINKPLIATGALRKGAAKRMAETIEFWVNATGENALDKFSEGFTSTIKVRLMHAYARVSILKDSEWDNAKWGAPINQWDMVATNLGFSLAFMNGLVNLGFRPSEGEVEGLLHLWKYIGYLLGIPAHYLPDTEEQSIRELYMWTITQPPADEDTKSLAWALLQEPVLSSYPRQKWLKRLMIKTHLAYNRFFLGGRSCDAMGLPQTVLRFYPYVIRTIKRMHEVFVNVSDGYRQATVLWGRSNQVKIKEMFLRGHSTTLVANQNRTG